MLMLNQSNYTFSKTPAVQFARLEVTQSEVVLDGSILIKQSGDNFFG